MNSVATHSAPTSPITGASTVVIGAGQTTVSVVTRMNFNASPGKVWEGLMFYEQIEKRPPLFLRLLLPVPVGAEGRKSQVGDEVKCRYRSGHLLKRVTQITQGRHCEFEVIEQSLALGGGIKLMGGSYTVQPLPEGRTGVALMTRYVSPHRPRWLCRRIEAAVCHCFHRHILSAMRDDQQLL